MTTTIKGEVGNVIGATVTTGALLDGTTVTSATFRAVSPDGGDVLTWTATIDSATTTSIVLSYEITAQLARGTWSIRPFLYTVGPVLVTALDIDSQQIRVQPDRVPQPT
jgi:hypothetical protein